MRTLLFILLLVAPLGAAAQTYDEAIANVAAARDPADDGLARRTTVEDGFDALTRHWLGTAWGLGLPQSSTPGEGKINCGTFVGTILHDLGFEVGVKKLQRQPAELIIKSFVPSKQMLRFRNRPIDEFVSKVSAAGDGVYIIGLDFHVGFLRVKDGEVRFVHASYVTGTVVDELASTSEPIVSSRYRVVGKIFDDKMLDAWVLGRPIAIKGNW